MGRVAWRLNKKTIDTQILFVFKSAEAGGAERVQLEVLRALRSYKSLTILTKRADNRHFLDAYKRYTTICDVSFFTNTIIGRWIYAGYLTEAVIHSNIKLIFGSLSGLLYDVAMLLPKGYIPVIELFHAADNNIEYYSLDSVENLDQRIVVNAQIKKLLEELYDRYAIDPFYKKRITVIANGVNVPRKYTPKSDGKLRCLYVGRDVAIKRVDLIREAAKRLPEVQFDLVGVEPKKGDPANVEAFGVRKDVEQMYQRAHCLLLLSEREGFPMAIQEAMAFGVVPVCTDVGGISSHLMHEKNGYLIQSRSEKEIINDVVNVIERLDKERSALKRVSLHAYAYAKEHFRIERFHKEYNNLLGGYLKDKNGPENHF